MGQWLTPIVGAVIIGVIIELLTERGRLGKFVRSIYVFFLLLVIVMPLPHLLDNLTKYENAPTPMIDQQLVTTIQQSGRQAQIQQTLVNLGYPHALVSVQSEAIYVSLGQAVTAQEIAQIQAQLGKGVVVI